jgi:alpha-beta hydrolase superfamily lysophospholipase
MSLKLILSVFFIFSGCATVKRVPQSAPSLQFGVYEYETNVPGIKTVKLRTGILNEAKESEFKGCVLYLEGLADSIRNHDALFSALSEAGFKVIGFDYMGQGGSEGSMNHTRIVDPVLPGLQIGSQAKAVWNNFAGECGQSKKNVIGWSTGGLAAYALAHDGWADNVVLIAPGIHPNKMVGEAAKSPLLLASFRQVITKRTLTSDHYDKKPDPHVDPIKPVSPALVPLFASNLLAAALVSHQWKIPAEVNGYVFLSGKNDTYVDSEATKNTLANKAPHFAIKEYDQALHEIDNEVPSVSQDMIARAVSFFETQVDAP